MIEITIKLSELIEAVITAQESLHLKQGLMCTNPKCIFNMTDQCGLKNVYIIDGKCPYYNAELFAKFDELFPEMANRHGSKIQG
jgi:hypothetical protein